MEKDALELPWLLQLGKKFLQIYKHQGYAAGVQSSLFEMAIKITAYSQSKH